MRDDVTYIIEDRMSGLIDTAPTRREAQEVLEKYTNTYAATRLLDIADGLLPDDGANRVVKVEKIDGADR
jgi:hypothetical protein